MTLHDLDVVADDVSASALGYRFDTAPAPAALASTVLEHPRHPVALRLSILGASHAVTVVVDGRDTVTEEVSCHATTTGAGLPPVSETSPGPWGTHRLRGSVESVSPVAFATLVEQLATLADSGPEVLAGRFPGPDGALTVVAATADPQGWSWQTWHLYPAGGPDSGNIAVGGEVVTTVSELVLSRSTALLEVGA